MEKHESNALLTPMQMTEIAEHYGVYKTQKSLPALLTLAASAGVFIGIAFIFYTTVTTGDGLSWGLQRLLGGLAFSIGLILLVVCGGELFTSTVLTSVARASKRINTRALLRVWAWTYVGNMIGALLLVAITLMGKLYMLDNGLWGLNALHIAQHKLHHSFAEAFALGVLCNLLVCLGIWMTFGARTMMEKAVLVILPVAMFVSTGFEHCVANMFMVPLAMGIYHFAEPSFWFALGIDGTELAQFGDLSLGNFIFHNLIPVTLGNICGGGLLVGMTYWSIYRRPEVKREQQVTTAPLLEPIENLDNKQLNA